jgi:hypothetical protein
MTPFTATMFFLLLGVALFSATRIIRLSLPWKSRTLLLALRFLLLSLIAISFWEPTMVFDQLPARCGVVPVLIDASKSMRLFRNDSTIDRTLSQLDAWNTAHSGQKQKFVFYGFGDSLVPLSNARSASWSNRRSFLPEINQANAINQAAAMLIISDGNWSNASLPSAIFSDKNVYYLPLNNPSPQPYLQIGFPGFPSESRADTPVIATAVVEGVSGVDANEITLSLTENNKLVSRRSISVQAGFFNKEVPISIKNAAPGRHLYRFEARSSHDSLQANRYFLHTGLPERFYYSLYYSHPTLDNRFISLALKRQNDFAESNDSGKTHDPDLLVFLDWDIKAQRLLNDLNPSGTALFLGTLPGNPVRFRSGETISHILRPPQSIDAAGPFDDFDAGKLPLPAAIAYCKPMPVVPQNVILTSVMQSSDRHLPPDTLKLFFNGRTPSNRNYIACTAREVWRWDFLPLAIEPDEDRVFTFSDRLIKLTKDMLINSLSDELFLYPSAPLTDLDSLIFTIVFPVGLPLAENIRLSCKFTSAQRSVYDTVFIIQSTGASRQTVRFKPQRCGVYRLDAYATAGNRNYRFTDSITVDEDRSEYMVNRQNTSLLQEIAQPVSDFTASSLHKMFFSNVSEVNQSVKKTIRLNRSWPLLILIFLFFTAEWIARRWLKLE